MRITLNHQDLMLAVGAFVAENAGYKIHLRDIELQRDFATGRTCLNVQFDKLPDPIVTELTLVDP